MKKTVPERTIAYITHVNARDRTIFSGTPWYVSYYLDTYCGNIIYIDNLIPDWMTPAYLLKNFFKNRAFLLVAALLRSKLLALSGKRFDWRMSLLAARYCAGQIERRLRQTPCDFIWVEKSCVSLRYLETDIPIIYESDATFRAMVEYYPWFSNLSKSALQNGDEIERTALEKAIAVVLTADWAKQSAVNDYNINPAKIHVLPSPPNWDILPDKDRVMRKKNAGMCTLLFVGVDWQRKGGDIATTAVETMIQVGIPSRLTVCGCIPPHTAVEKPFVEAVGFLDKNNEKDRIRWEELFLAAHFFILPTRAECMGISFSEAMAFGLPLLATDAGGVATVVKHDINGILFDYNEDPEIMGRKIADLWNDKKKYEKMRIGSRRFFDEHICGDAWAASVNHIIEKISESS